MFELIILFSTACITAIIALKAGSKKSALLIALPTYLFAAAMQGLRIGGSDWSSYSSLFDDIIGQNDIRSAVISGFLQNYEPGLPIVYHLVGIMGGEFRWTILLEASVSFASFVALSKKTRFAILYLILTFPATFANSMGVRINLAISIAIIIICVTKPFGNNQQIRSAGGVHRLLPRRWNNYVLFVIPLSVHFMSIFFLVAAHAEELGRVLWTRLRARHAGLLGLLAIVISCALAVLVKKYSGLSFTFDIDPKMMIGSTLNFLFGAACIHICKGYLKKDLSLLLISIQLVSPFIPYAGRVANLLMIGIFLSLVIGSEIELHTHSAAITRRMHTLLFVGSGYGMIKFISLAPIIPIVYNPCFFCYSQ